MACVMGWSASDLWAQISALSLVSYVTALSWLGLCQPSVLLVAWSLDQKLQALHGSPGCKGPESLNHSDGLTASQGLVSAK